MDKIVINKNYVNSLKIHSMNRNSTIFVKDNDLIKMPKIIDEYKHSNLETVILSKFDKIIEHISSILEQNYVLPKTHYIHQKLYQ